MKKGDICIFLTLAVVTLCAFFIVFSNGQPGNTVVITENDGKSQSYPLTVDRTVELKGNSIQIKRGKVFMAEADCKNQLCVKHKAIKKKGESIICLPNKVIIEIRQEENEN